MFWREDARHGDSHGAETGTQLAVMSSSYFLDPVNQLDDGWYEVVYEDSDVRVHGFASTRDPPGRTHRRPSPQPQQTQRSLFAGRGLPEISAGRIAEIAEIAGASGQVSCGCRVRARARDT